MHKLSAAQAQAVLAQVPGQLRKLASENESLRARVEELEQEKRLQKLAKRMEEKGLDPDLSEEDRMARLTEQARAGRLDVLEQAVVMAAGRAPLGELAGEEMPGNGANELESYLLGGLSHS